MGWQLGFQLSGKRWICARAFVVVCVCTLVCVFALAGCGKNTAWGQAATPASPGSAGNLPADSQQSAWGQASPPALQDLEAELAKAFASLGIEDPSKVPAAAPTGADNAVFDLAASLIDPDGAGGNPPTGVTLTWTERMLGDYDANGEVGYPDLVPLSQHWLSRAEYDDSALHGGLTYWPAGDPEDGGTGSANWVLARVDGDGNTEIGTGGDIVTIAEHWNERLAGYRVYAKAPGEPGFSLIETLDHPAGTHADAPVRYSFDASVAGTGVHSYYVAPVDADGSEGTVSGIITIDVDTGTVNHAPVAALEVSPGFSGAPATITLDASASYDVDGDALTFAWDFDADGTVDWVSTDAVPEESSTGLADNITAVNDGVVTAQYTRGSADWYYPEVKAIDSEGAESTAASAKLGLSGWERELISSTDDSAVFNGEELSFNITDLAEDPVTHELVAAGSVSSSKDFTPDAVPYTIYWARRSTGGNWSQEVTVSLDDPNLTVESLSGVPSNPQILWAADCQPILIVTVNYTTLGGFNTWMITTKRDADGEWSTAYLYGGTSGVKGTISSAHQTELGSFQAMASDILSSSQYKYYLLSYDDGDISLEYTGFDTSEHEYTQRNSQGMAFDNIGAPYLLLSNWNPETATELNYWKRTGFEEWEPGSFDEGQTETFADKLEELDFNKDNIPVCLAIKYGSVETGSTVYLTEGSGTGIAIHEVRSGTKSSSGYSLLLAGDAYMVLSNASYYEGEYVSSYESYCDRLEGSTQIKETVFSIGVEQGRGAIQNGYLTVGGTAYCITGVTLTEGVNVYNQYLSHRVDPRP